MTYIRSLYLIPNITSPLRSKIINAVKGTSSIGGLLQCGRPGYFFFEGVPGRSQHFTAWLEKTSKSGAKLLLSIEKQRGGRAVHKDWGRVETYTHDQLEVFLDTLVGCGLRIFAREVRKREEASAEKKKRKEDARERISGDVFGDDEELTDAQVAGIAKALWAGPSRKVMSEKHKRILRRKQRTEVADLRSGMEGEEDVVEEAEGGRRGGEILEERVSYTDW